MGQTKGPGRRKQGKKAMVLACHALLLLCLSLFSISYARPGRHFLVETESNEGNNHRTKTNRFTMNAPWVPKYDKGDDSATLANKGGDHARKANKVLPNLDLGFNLEDNIAKKANKGDDYADYVKDKAKAKPKARTKANAKAIAKAKAKLLQALKANKGDDYASNPKELFVDAAAGKAISSKLKRGDDYVDYAAYMRNEECDESREEWRENGMTCNCHTGGKHVSCASDPSCTDHEDGTRTCVG